MGNFHKNKTQYVYLSYRSDNVTDPSNCRVYTSCDDLEQPGGELWKTYSLVRPPRKNYWSWRLTLFALVTIGICCLCCCCPLGVYCVWVKIHTKATENTEANQMIEPNAEEVPPPLSEEQEARRLNRQRRRAAQEAARNAE